MSYAAEKQKRAVEGVNRKAPRRDSEDNPRNTREAAAGVQVAGQGMAGEQRGWQEREPGRAGEASPGRKGGRGWPQLSLEGFWGKKSWQRVCRWIQRELQLSQGLGGETDTQTLTYRQRFDILPCFRLPREDPKQKIRSCSWVWDRVDLG